MKLIVTNKEYEALVNLAVKVECNLDLNGKVLSSIDDIREKKNEDDGIIKLLYDIKNPETEEITHMVEVNPDYLEEVLNFELTPFVTKVLRAVLSMYELFMGACNDLKGGMERLVKKYKKEDEKEEKETKKSSKKRTSKDDK